MEPLDSLKPFGGKSLSWLRIYSLDLASFHSAKWFLKKERERWTDRKKEDYTWRWSEEIPKRSVRILLGQTEGYRTNLEAQEEN